VEYVTEFWTGTTYPFPRDSSHVVAWYSPTGSFLQIQEKKEELRCGTNTTFRVQYTTSEEQTVQLFYKVYVRLVHLRIAN